MDDKLLTLIINYSDHLGSFCVSDRYVSAKGQVVRKNFNKSIISLHNDAVLTTSFTGNAIVGGMPADNYIANLICGAGQDPVWNRLGRLGPRWAKFSNQVIGRLFKGIQLLKRSDASLDLEVIVSGNRVWRRRKCIPMCVVISTKAGPPSVSLESLPSRNLLQFGATLMHASGGYSDLYPDPWLNFSESVKEILSQGESRDQILIRMIETLRVFAKKFPNKIGSSVQAINTNIVQQSTKVTFHASELLRVNGPKGLRLGPAVYTPWFISSNNVSPPGQLSGMPMRVGGAHSVEFIPPDAARGLPAAFLPHVDRR